MKDGKSDWELTIKASEITRSSMVDENARLALQLESVKERDTVKKANELKAEVQVLTQQASDMAVQCLSVRKDKEIYPMNSTRQKCYSSRHHKRSG